MKRNLIEEERERKKSEKKRQSLRARIGGSKLNKLPDNELIKRTRTHRRRW